MNIADAIRAHAQSAPGRPALIEGDRTLDHGALERCVAAAMEGLRTAGLRRGRIAALLPFADPLLHAVAMIALARLGVVQVPFRGQEPADSRDALLRSLGAAAVIADGPRRGWPLPLVRAAPAWLRGTVPGNDPGEADGDLPWIVAHSSGSTGLPKAIGVTHGIEIARMARDRQIFSHPPGEPFLTLIGPGFYNSASATLRCLAQGGAVVLAANRGTAGSLVAMVERHRIGFLQMTPSHLHALVEALPAGGLALPQLRVLRVSSAALPARILDLARSRLTRNVHLTYGTNEAGTLAVATPAMLARHPGTVGPPLQGIEVELRRADGGRAGPGEAGEIRVRGPGVIDRYLDDPEATRRHCREGWFHPGDRAIRDDQGWLFLRGRSDRVMNIGGVLTAAEEIEAVLLAHPDVAEAAAVPLPSERFQVIPGIAVVLRRPVPVPTLVEHASRSLRGHPVEIHVLSAVPRTAIGKVDYRGVAAAIDARRTG